MPLIKARTRGKQLVRHITRLDRETNETLYAYAHFLGEPTEYVLNQLVDTVLAKDKEFVAWRVEHHESCVTGERRTGRSARRNAAAEPDGFWPTWAAPPVRRWRSVVLKGEHEEERTHAA
jgi:hypothetical protein